MTHAQTAIEAAEAAWLAYRDGPMRNWPRRQIRRREFLAGYMAAVEAYGQSLRITLQDWDRLNTENHRLRGDK